MKQLLSFLMLLVSITASAQQFTYTYEGQTLNYSVLDNEAKKCQVTFTGMDLYGAIVIPEKVYYEQSEYTVTSIGQYAFRDCDYITSIDIPSSITSIGFAAFNFCGLIEVNIHDIAAWCNIDLISYDSNPMCCAEFFKLNGEEIRNLVIPSSVTSIGDWAFYNCKGLTSVDIPNSVNSIGRCAFSGCSNLTTIYSLNSIPQSVGNLYCFDDTHYKNATLYVPQEALEAYKTAEMWKEFKNIVGIDPTGVENVNAVDNNADRIYYDMNGRRLIAPIKGLNIANGKKVMMR